MYLDALPVFVELKPHNLNEQDLRK